MRAPLLTPPPLGRGSRRSILQVLAKYGHFGVLNRPHSVVEFFKDPELRKRITEEWVMIAETDHVLTKPMPNLATETAAAAHSF